MSEDFEFYIDIENATGVIGPGPITSATRWTYTARADKAGTISFEMPAADPLAQYVTRKRKARGWALLNSVWTEVGAMIIDHIERKPGDDGIILLAVSGDDELRELAGYSIGATDLSGGGVGVTHADALLAITAHRTTGWTYVPALTPGNDFVYGKFAGESTLAALIAIANKTLTHFYRSGPRTLTFASAFTASGLRAIQADGDTLAAETCAIAALTETTDTYDMLTRITPYGSGNGEARLTIAKSTRSSPTGYTSNKSLNWIRHIASETEFGVIDSPSIEFKSVRAISNTDADLEAAANVLFDLALRELTRRVAMQNTATYTVTLAGCSRLLLPMQSLRVVYRDDDAGMDIDQTMNILAATWEISKEGIQTTAVDLSTSDTWPEDDTDAVVARITESSLYQAHPQINANAYVIPFSKNLDDDRSNPAEFRFRFDQEVLQVIRVCFDFKLLPLESTVKSIGGTSTSTTASGDHTHTVTITGHTHTATTSNHTHTVTITAHTHTATTSNHSHTVSISGHTHSVTIGSHSHDMTIHGTSGSPTGSRPFARQLYYDATDDNFYADIGAGTDPAKSTSSGGSSSPTSSSGGSSSPTSSSGGGETVTSSSGGSSSPTSSNGGSETVTSSSGGSTTATSASGGSHTHALTASVSTVYGVFRDSTSTMYALTDIEYSVDNITWYFFIPGVNGFASLGDDWYRVDVTALLQDATGFRPLSANNLLQIRRKSTTLIAGKHVTIDAQLSIRTTIQSIAYS